MDKLTLKSLFHDDPEMLRILELREQNGLLKEIADHPPESPTEALKVMELREQTKHLNEIASQKVDLEKLKQELLPIKGIHYFDGVDGEDGQMGLRGEKGDQGESGETGEDGKNITLEEARLLLQDLLQDLELGLPQKQVESLIKKHITTTSNKLAQSIATLRGDVERNYGGHGGSGGNGTLSMEVPVGTVDGSNTTFNVSHTPLYIEVSGQTMVSQTQDAVNYGYTLSGLTVTFVNAPIQTPHSWYQ